jgi:hypothetical protein
VLAAMYEGTSVDFSSRLDRLNNTHASADPIRVVAPLHPVRRSVWESLNRATFVANCLLPRRRGSRTDQPQRPPSAALSTAMRVLI